MVFEAVIQRERREDCPRAGRLCKAAVKCWFTSKGKAMPLMAKIEDGEGGILTLKPIRVKTTRQSWYAGTAVWEYECSVDTEGRERSFFLHFYPETCQWKMRISGGG